jgi:TonB family protein
VLWHDRDFWFPDSSDAESEEAESPPGAGTIPAAQQPAPVATAPAVKTAGLTAKPKHHGAPLQVKAATPQPVSPPVTTTTTRTVLPPLEVEVIAGDTHHKLRPGSNSIHVELQPGTRPEPATDPNPPASETAATVTSDAAERVQMSADTAEAVSRPVKPSYPLLARQMKVQGSVILHALVGKDGVIQDLRVVSGPPILATAAQDAVRQWRFRPHFEGSDAVETQAKITVNFTISTN